MTEVTDLRIVTGKGTATEPASFRLRNGTVTWVLGDEAQRLTETLSGAILPASGNVRIGGTDLCREPIRARLSVGYLPDPRVFCEEMTPFEYLSMVCELHRIPYERRIRRVQELLTSGGMDDLRNREIRRLTFAERARLGILQAVAAQPELLLLENPFAGLLPADREELAAMLSDLRGSAAVILTAGSGENTDLLPGSVWNLTDGRLEFGEETPAESTEAETGETEWIVTVRGEKNDVLRALGEVEGILSCRPGALNADGCLRLTLRTVTDLDAELSARLSESFSAAGCELVSAERKEGTL